ncbi:putative signal transducing protein [Alistipes putredinis]
MKDEKLVVLREWNSVTEAEMAKSILDGAGIFSTIRNEYMSAIYPIGTMPAQLVVKEEDAKRAAELLDKMPQFIILQLFKEFGKLLKKPPNSL